MSPLVPSFTPASDDSLASVVRVRVRALLQSLGHGNIEGVYPVVMREVERSLLETVLTHADGSRSEAARILGLHRNSLRLRLRATGLEPARPRRSSRSSGA